MSKTEKVYMYGYGFAVTYADNIDPDGTDEDEALKNARGFLGYDDQAGRRFYFYITPKHRTEAKNRLLRLSENHIGPHYAQSVEILSNPVRFAFRPDWLKDSADEIRPFGG